MEQLVALIIASAVYSGYAPDIEVFRGKDAMQECLLVKEQVEQTFTDYGNSRGFKPTPRLPISECKLIKAQK